MSSSEQAARQNAATSAVKYKYIFFIRISIFTIHYSLITIHSLVSLSLFQVRVGIDIILRNGEVIVFRVNLDDTARRSTLPLPVKVVNETAKAHKIGTAMTFEIQLTAALIEQICEGEVVKRRYVVTIVSK